MAEQKLYAGFTPISEDTITTWMEKGFRVLSLSSDFAVQALDRSLTLAVDAARDALEVTGDVKASVSNAEEASREFVRGQSAVAREFLADPLAATQKAADLYLKSGQRALEAGIANGRALLQAAEKAQGRLQKAGKDQGEQFVSYLEQVRSLLLPA